MTKKTVRKFYETPSTLIPDLFVFVIMVSTIIFAFLTYMEMGPLYVSIIFTSTLVMLFCYLVFYNYKNTIIFLSIFLLYMLILITGFPRFLEPLTAPAGDFFYWLIQTVFIGDIYSFAEQASAFCLFIVVVFTLLYYLMVIKFRKFIPASVATVVLFIYLNIAEINLPAKRVYITCFFVVIFTLLYFYIANRYRIISKNNEFVQNNISYLKWQKYIIPILIFILVLSIVIMPADINRNLRNDNVYNFIENIRSDLEKYMNGQASAIEKKFSLSQVGFDKENSSRLGGPVELKNDHIFDVKTSKTVYLRGAVYDNYTGSGWTSTISESGTAYFNSDNSGYRSTFDFDDYNKPYFQLSNVNLINIDLNTTTVFNTNYLIGLSNVKNDTVFYNQRTEMFSNKNIKDNSYLFRFYEPDLNNTELQSRLKLGEFSWHNPSYNDINNPDYTRFKNIQKLYEQLPDSLPSEIKNLALSVTNDKYNEFDKVTALCDYIKSNYKYSLTPSDPPKNMDFTENFLFREREGYCTYFATAMTVMCRSLGYPARYVSGFRVDYDGTGEKTLNVRSYNAHAWTEVFFPDLGWLTFDAVAASDFRTNAAYVKNPFGTNGPQQPSRSPTPSKTPAHTSPAPTPSPTETKPTNYPVETVKTQPPLTTAPGSFVNGNVLTIAVISGLVLSCLIVIPLILIRRKKRNKKLTGRALLANLIDQFIRISEVLGISIDDRETVVSFFNKISSALPQIEEYLFTFVTERPVKLSYEELGSIFDKALYSDYVPSEDDMKQINLFHERLKLDQELTKNYLQNNN